MIAAILAEGPGLVTISQQATNSPYPPSFDNNPIVFGWALFARLLVFTMSAATIVRVHSRQRIERLPVNHPVYHHRMANLCFLYAAMLGSLSDCLTYLLWNETGEYLTTLVMLLARVFDGWTMFPFVMALFVPVWMRWLKEIGIVRPAPSMLMGGMYHDMKATWPTFRIPLQLLFYSAGTSVFATVGKYFLWIEHVRP